MTSRPAPIRRAIARHAIRALRAAGIAALLLVCIPVLIVKTFADAKAAR